MKLTDFSYLGAMIPHAATGYQLRWSMMTPLLQLMVPRALFAGKTGRYIAFNRFCVNGAAYGGLAGPADDAARLLQAHLNGGALNGARILSATSSAAMQNIATRDGKMDVGLGWFRFHSARGRLPGFIEHLGGGGGFFNVMRLYPERGLGIVIMGNATSYDHEAMARSIIDQPWD
jgi:CubicO group peptidase (beta-lactamase class C family)